MSRSHKKPYVSTVCIVKKAMKFWKKTCNRRVRRTPVDRDLYAIKKITDRWLAPDDGRTYIDEPKYRRK